METYFFIPATKISNFHSLKDLSTDNFIIDFEDSVKSSQSKDLMNQLTQDYDFKGCYLRIPLYNTNSIIDISFLKAFLESGFSKFIFPKISSIKDLEIILEKVSSHNFKFILLIESPQLYLELFSNIGKYKNVISAIALGSHDFLSVVGGKHSLSNLEILRQNVLYMARSIGAEAIDIATMELEDPEKLKNEILDGFEKGYDAKFIIHPWQLKIHHQIKFFSKEDYLWALKVKEVFNQVGKEEEFNPIVIDGQVIEKPHLKKMKKILNYFEHDSE